MRSMTLFLIALLTAGLLCASCAGPPEVGITENTVYDMPMPKTEYEYELGPGDTLEIIYHYTPKPDTSTYYLAVGDVIKVEFAYHPDINRTLTVRPDGNVAMPRKGDVRVLGLTPSGVQQKITYLYSKEFVDPIVTITMVQYNTAIEQLRKAITTAPRGQSKLTTVRPDGYASFPLIEDILAKGKTVPELKKIVTAEYSKQIDNLTLSVILQEMRANLVYITGMVVKPNYYLMEGPTSVSQIIARAGGTLSTAEKSTILVISRDEERRPWARLVDYAKILEDGDRSQDIVLHQYDVVYVPRSAISRRNLFVEQYINNMIPANLLGPYNLGGTVISKPLIK